MIPLHFLGLLTLQLIALLGAFMFKSYVEKNALEKRYQHAAKFVLIAVHVLIILTIVHAVIFHLMHGCHMDQEGCMKMMHH